MIPHPDTGRLRLAFLISAGVARMPLRRYVAATAVGAIAWAAVYTTVGMTILMTWLTAPIGRIVSVLTGTALVLIVMIRRSRSVRDDRSH